MTISSEVRKAGPFDGNDVTTSFPFAFKVFTTADVLVVVADELGAETTLVLNTDYTVSLNANQNTSPGGTVVLSSALATGETMVITSDVANLQPVDLTNAGGFYPEVLNAALDRATIQIQQLAEQVDRSIKVSLTSGLSPDEFIEDLQQAESNASASAAAAAASAAAAALFDPDNFVLKVDGDAQNLTVDDLTVTTLNGGQLAGFRNKIRNGRFRINQRNWASGSFLSSGSVGFDGWIALNSGVGTGTYATVNGVVVITMASTDFWQRVFGEEIQGDGSAGPFQYVLSWGGDASVEVTNTAAGTVSSLTSPLVLSLTPGVDINVRLKRVGNSDVHSVQLEQGTEPTPFEQRPDAIELAICQAHYYRESIASSQKPYSATCQNLSGSFRALFRNPVKMRTAPTVLDVSGTPGDFQLVHGATAVALTNTLTLSQATEWTVLLDSTLAGLTDGRVGYLRNTSANATYIGWGSGY